MNDATEKLYEQDAYLKESGAVVVDVLDNGVILDKTIFYPRGGGQPTDRGMIVSNSTKSEVLDLKKDGNRLIHVTDGKFTVGDHVHLEIDWNYRYKLMKHHTTLHVLSAVVYNKYNAKVTGGSISHDKARLDFDLIDFNKEIAQELVDELNKELKKDHQVSVSFISREEVSNHPELIRTKVNLLPESIKKVRIVKIGDIDLQADGGLHVHSTKEIGDVQLLKISNKGKGRKRITVGVIA